MLSSADPDAWRLAKWSLRGDLRAWPRPLGDGRVCYVLEDPLQNRFFRIGAAEYALASRLDGRRTVQQALDELPDEHRLTEDQAQRIVQWLISAQLVRIAGAAQGQRLYELGRKQERRERKQRYNPLTARMPLAHPDRMLARLSPWVAWLGSAWFLWLTLGLAALSGWRVAGQWDRVQEAAGGVLSPDRWLWLAACWLGLKFVHEMAHGLICRLYGGNVREAGVMLLYFFPVAYVDVTSSWRFRSKWQRIHTAAAGMQIELLIASAAALVWCQLRTGVLSDICFSLAVAASVTTVLFNANPLMRFDGYYILSDLLAIPNLYGAALSQVAAVARRVFLGVSQPPSSTSLAPPWLLLGYGVAVLLWRVVVIAGIVLMLSQWFHGAGLVLAVFVGASWLLVPLTRFVRYLANSPQVTCAARWRLALVSGGVAVAMWALLAMPWSPRGAAPAIVDFSPLTVVRSPGDGFVRQVLVKDGQRVEAGQILLRLTSRELELEITQREQAVRASLVELRRRQQADDPSGYQAERRRLQSLSEQLAESRQLLQSLEVAAPVAGRVMNRQLRHLEGRHFKAGAKLLAIGDERQKELQVSIDQRQLDRLRQIEGRPEVRVRIAGHPRFRAPITTLEPLASAEPLHESMCSPNGGPLPVTIDEQGGAMRLLQPRFTARVELPPQLAAQLHAGRRADVVLQCPRRTLLDYARRAASDWLDRRL